MLRKGTTCCKAKKDRHILAISGGMDSAALAVYMSKHYPDLELEYATDMD